MWFRERDHSDDQTRVFVYRSDLNSLEVRIAEFSRRSRYISPYRGACGTTVTSARI